MFPTCPLQLHLSKQGSPQKTQEVSKPTTTINFKENDQSITRTDCSEKKKLPLDFLHVKTSEAQSSRAQFITSVIIKFVMKRTVHVWLKETRDTDLPLRARQLMLEMYQNNTERCRIRGLTWFIVSQSRLMMFIHFLHCRDCSVSTYCLLWDSSLHRHFSPHTFHSPVPVFNGQKTVAHSQTFHFYNRGVFSTRTKQITIVPMFHMIGRKRKHFTSEVSCRQAEALKLFGTEKGEQLCARCFRSDIAPRCRPKANCNKTTIYTEHVDRLWQVNVLKTWMAQGGSLFTRPMFAASRVTVLSFVCPSFEHSHTIFTTPFCPFVCVCLAWELQRYSCRSLVCTMCRQSHRQCWVQGLFKSLSLACWRVLLPQNPYPVPPVPVETNEILLKQQHLPAHAAPYRTAHPGYFLTRIFCNVVTRGSKNVLRWRNVLCSSWTRGVLAAPGAVSWGSPCVATVASPAASALLWTSSCCFRFVPWFACFQKRKTLNCLFWVICHSHVNLGETTWRTHRSRSALFLMLLSAITCLLVSIDSLACFPFRSLFSLERYIKFSDDGAREHGRGRRQKIFQSGRWVVGIHYHPADLVGDRSS